MQYTIGVYVMQVASILTGMHPQTLRKYERAGFVTPSRNNVLRMYSDEDIARLKRIRHLVEEGGLNLAGVQLALKLHERILDIKRGLASTRMGADCREQLEQSLNEILEMLETADIG